MKSRRWTKTALLCLCGAILLVAFSGCQTVSFYRQAIAGEYQILSKEKPITQLIADPATPPKLKAKFEEILKMRQFARDEMKEPADKAYLKYTDLHRPYVVWNVNIAPALSMDPKTWWFPIVGRASYRGYFNLDMARKYAEPWKEKGWDIYVDGVTAYSTLGWFSDPLLNTFIYEPEADLADLIFHELAHRRLFISGDTDFNESYATAVAAEGVRRWFNAASNPKAYEEHMKARQREKDFVRLVLQTRQDLTNVYNNAQLSDTQKLQRKEEIIADLRTRYQAMKTNSWGGYSGYDGWFKAPINNAKLNTISAYYQYEPAFAALIREENGDMEKFFARVAEIGKMPVEKRHSLLQEYLAKTPPAAK